MSEAIVYPFNKVSEISVKDSLSEAQRLHIQQSAPQMPVLRWNRARKAAVVATIRAGIFTPEQVCKTYELSAEELARWIELMDDFGVNGLEVTKVQKWRGTARGNSPRQSVA